MSEAPHRSDPHEELTVRVGRDELVVRQRYEVASILNDILIALWFIAGSVMFFSPEWTRTGVWCFLLGSVELAVRPAIRLGRQLHLRRFRTGGHSPHIPRLAHSSDMDY